MSKSSNNRGDWSTTHYTVPVGTTFDKLTCISEEYKKPRAGRLGRAFYIKVKCICGLEYEMTKHNFVNKKKKKKQCKKCGRKDSANKRKNGFGEVSGRYVSTIRSGAARRGIYFKLSAKDMWEIFELQDHKCALSGIPLEMKYDGDRECSNTASLDRIDSSKGYERDNIQWVHKDINIMKWAFSSKRFIELCSSVHEYNKKRQESL